MIAYVFPGQGSQYVGMAKEFANIPAAKELMMQSDDILQVHLTKIMTEGPEEMLRQTEFTQPAIFLHSILALRFGDHHEPPKAFAGHSLGEFTALCASGALEFVDALNLVFVRGKLMAESGKRSPGTMAAIIGMDAATLKKMCEEIEMETGNIVRPANYNSPGQIVVSGSVHGVHEAIRRAKEKGIRIAKELPVSGAFHSPLMQYAADGLKEVLASTIISKPTAPVFANASAQPHGEPDAIRDLLVEQLTAPVRWEEIIHNMYDYGIREFVEFG
ncbi:MAG: ACP S-malonyltransferase, partial [Bacteroidota bacterium]|nr:ACP S-malonyltransferase [Bacteroidota bacterium]